MIQSGSVNASITLGDSCMSRLQIPRLILGHLPFLGESYQGKSKNHEYAGTFSKIENTIRILTKAIEEYEITVLSAVPARESQLAKQHLEALRVASQRAERKISLIPCLRIPLTIDGVMIDDYRRWLNYCEAERKVDDGILERYLEDPILQCRENWKTRLLDASVNSTPYSAKEIKKLSINYDAVRACLESLQEFNILFVEPGSETDFLVAAGRVDLLNELVEYIRSTYGYEVIFGTHHAGSTIPALDKSGIRFHGYVTPINPLGVMMFPTQQLVLDAVKNTNKLVIAIKPLAGGRIPPKQAFRYVYETANVDSCMVGVGSEMELEADLKAVRELTAVTAHMFTGPA